MCSCDEMSNAGMQNFTCPSLSYEGMHHNFQTMPPTPGQGPATPAHQRQAAQTMNVSGTVMMDIQYRHVSSSHLKYTPPHPQKNSAKIIVI
jgi:hypothetical protein